MSQTLERALKILHYVAKEPRRIGDIATFLGVHHSTALRLLQSLRRQGFVFELSDHRYRLGAATFRLGYQALEAMDLRDVARPFMERLNDLTRETVHLGTLEGDSVTYIDKVEARHAVRMHSRVGALANLHCAAVAKAILAFLPSAERQRILRGYKFEARTEHSLTSRAAFEEDLDASRERGFVLDAEENEPGIHCVGMPIFDGAGQIAGAMSVSCPMSRIDRETLISFVPALGEATTATSRELGWQPAAVASVESPPRRSSPARDAKPTRRRRSEAHASLAPPK